MTIAIPQSLRINPDPCTPNQVAENFREIIRQFVTDDRVIRFKLTADLEHGSTSGAAAVIRTFDGTSYVDGDAIHVFDWNVITDPLEPFDGMGWWWGVTGSEGIAKRREVSATSGRLEYDIIWMETQQVVRFKLSAAFNTGNDSQTSGVNALIRRFNGTDYEDSSVTIRVWDFQGQSPTGDATDRGMWQAPSGSEGIAVLREHPTIALSYKPEYDVIWMEQYAFVIQFTLTSTFTAGDATATVGASWEQGNAPTSPLTVHDTSGNFTDAEIGDVGFAVRDEYATPTLPATPYYRVIYLPPKKVVRFRLSANLNTGSNAAASKLTWNGSSYTSSGSITVYDWWGVSGRGMWQAVSGMEGWASAREGAPGHYDIIWMEVYAFTAEGTLANHLGGGTATGTFGDTWEQGVDPGASHTVHDDQGYSPDAIGAGKFTVLRTEYETPTAPATPYYKLVQSTHPCFFATVELTADMCGGAATFDSWTVIPIGNFRDDPGAPAAFTNPRGHYAQVFDTILLLRVTNTAPNFTWEVIDVPQKEFVETRVRWNADLKCLQIQERVMAAESCEEGGEWGSIICGEEC